MDFHLYLAMDNLSQVLVSHFFGHPQQRYTASLQIMKSQVSPQIQNFCPHSNNYSST